MTFEDHLTLMEITFRLDINLILSHPRGDLDNGSGQTCKLWLSLDSRAPLPPSPLPFSFLSIESHCVGQEGLELRDLSSSDSVLRTVINGVSRKI